MLDRDLQKLLIDFMKEHGIRHHQGIPLISGVNDCYWVYNGRCTNPDVTRNKIQPCFVHDWNSKMNCPLTICGSFNCGGFKIMYERITQPYLRNRVNRVLHENGQGTEERPTDEPSTPENIDGGGI
jgi:hypothetical protein